MKNHPSDKRRRKQKTAGDPGGETDRIAIGSIRTSWGVKGWVKLNSFSGEWDHFADVEQIRLKSREGRIHDAQIEKFMMQHGGGLFKIIGIDNPEDAKALAGAEIWVDRSHAAALNADEWYLSDLIGLRLEGESGEALGEIIGIIESADDLLEIQRPDGRRFLIPFRKAFVGEPDLERGRLELLAPWLAEDQ